MLLALQDAADLLHLRAAAHDEHAALGCRGARDERAHDDALDAKNGQRDNREDADEQAADEVELQPEDQRACQEESRHVDFDQPHEVVLQAAAARRVVQAEAIHQDRPDRDHEAEERRVVGDLGKPGVEPGPERVRREGGHDKSDEVDDIEQGADGFRAIAQHVSRFQPEWSVPGLLSKETHARERVRSTITRLPNQKSPNPAGLSSSSADC